MLIALFVHFGSSHALPCLTIGPVCWSLDGMPRLKSVAKIRNDRQSVVWFQVWNHMKTDRTIVPMILNHFDSCTYNIFITFFLRLFLYHPQNDLIFHWCHWVLWHRLWRWSFSSLVEHTPYIPQVHPYPKTRTTHWGYIPHFAASFLGYPILKQNVTIYHMHRCGRWGFLGISYLRAVLTKTEPRKGCRFSQLLRTVGNLGFFVAFLLLFCFFLAGIWFCSIRILWSPNL
jgi:hypothetical protein